MHNFFHLVIICFICVSHFFICISYYILWLSSCNNTLVLHSEILTLWFICAALFIDYLSYVIHAMQQAAEKHQNVTGTIEFSLILCTDSMFQLWTDHSDVYCAGLQYLKRKNYISIWRTQTFCAKMSTKSDICKYVLKKLMKKIQGGKYIYAAFSLGLGGRAWIQLKI